MPRKRRLGPRCARIQTKKQRRLNVPKELPVPASPPQIGLLTWDSTCNESGWRHSCWSPTVPGPGSTCWSTASSCQTPSVEPSALLSVADVDGRALLAAAEPDWKQRVPHCPEWDAAGLVRHTASIFMWMAAIVASGGQVSRRTLSPAPEDPAGLASCYVESLDQVLAVLGSADPNAPTWTFSTTGDRTVRWWCRRLAVEVAIHRWDVQHAGATGRGPAPEPVDGEVAAAGVEEFVAEFLPGLLAAPGVDGLVGTLHLHATDGPVEWWIDLDRGGSAVPGHAEADTAIRGSRSDLLLWLTNRGPLDSLMVVGDGAVTDSWHQLRR